MIETISSALLAWVCFGLLCVFFTGLLEAVHQNEFYLNGPRDEWWLNPCGIVLAAAVWPGLLFGRSDRARRLIRWAWQVTLDAPVLLCVLFVAGGLAGWVGVNEWFFVLPAGWYALWRLGH